ncbi:PQQ-binding-like beta-propeller repeat protein [Actinotalea sp. AC32]|nr:PQQ-binding-like beta-propeller repeat protein [Actinotalea sp. AC32]
MRRRSDAEMVVVELTDADDASASPSAPSAADASRPEGGTPSAVGGASDRARRRGRRTGALALAATLAVGAVVAANVVEQRAEAARRAALVDLPGVVAPLPSAPVELWRATGWSEADVVGDALLVRGGDGGAELRDVGTGAVRAVVGGDGRACTVVPASAIPGVEPSSLVSCRTQQRDGGYAVDLLDADGAALASVVLPGEVLLEQQVDDDVVHVVRTPDGSVQVRRTEPATGDERWVHRSSVRAGDDAWAVVAVDRVLVMGADSSRSAVALDDGAEVARTEDDGVVVLDVLPDGRRLEAVLALRTRMRVSSPDGDVLFEEEGGPATYTLDPAAREVVLRDLTGPGLRVHDLASGDVVWTIEDDDVWPVLHLADVLVVTAGHQLQGWDPRTGQRLWTRDLPASQWSSVLGPESVITDGARVMVPEPASDGPELVAVDLASGDDSWRVPLPDAADRVVSARGRILVLGGGDVVVLGAR